MYERVATVEEAKDWHMVKEGIRETVVQFKTGHVHSYINDIGEIWSEVTLYEEEHDANIDFDIDLFDSKFDYDFDCSCTGGV